MRLKSAGVLICLKGRHILKCFPWNKITVLLIEHFSCDGQISPFLWASFGLVCKGLVLCQTSEWVSSQWTVRHCFLERSLLIFRIYLLFTSKVFTKSASEYFPWVSLSKQGHLYPEKVHVIKAISSKGDGIFFHIAFSVPKILVKMFIVLFGKSIPWR